MHGYVTNIERDTLANDDYRRVLYTGPNTHGSPISASIRDR
jgi:hypothetical protein